MFSFIHRPTPETLGAVLLTRGFRRRTFVRITWTARGRHQHELVWAICSWGRINGTMFLRCFRTATPEHETMDRIHARPTNSMSSANGLFRQVDPPTNTKCSIKSYSEISNDREWFHIPIQFNHLQLNWFFNWAVLSSLQDFATCISTSNQWNPFPKAIWTSQEQMRFHKAIVCISWEHWL